MVAAEIHGKSALRKALVKLLKAGLSVTSFPLGQSGALLTWHYYFCFPNCELWLHGPTDGLYFISQELFTEHRVSDLLSGEKPRVEREKS